MSWSWPSRQRAVKPPPRIEPVVRLPRAVSPVQRSPIAVSPALLHASRRNPARAVSPWTLPEPPPGMLPAGAATMAQDADIGSLYGWAGGTGGMGGFAGLGEGLAFHGYPYLAELSQRPEYRRAAEIIAKEMTRKWIKLTSAGDDDNTAKLSAIDAAMKRLRVQQAFCRMAELDGFFGKAQLYPDTGANPADLATPLVLSPATVKRGSLKRLKVVEPIWTYPAVYNSTDPLAPDFYKPQAWYMMGRQLHASRLLTFVAREMPDMLKPAYMFGGLSLTQMGKPYVDNWIRTRKSVSDLISSFSVSGIKTNMAAALTGGAGTGLADRMELFNNLRDNSGSMLLDKDTEEFFNVATPLGTLDHLQAQSQEHMSSVWGIPLIVLLGITPSGLNASSEGELAAWNAWIEAQQEHLFGDHLTTVLKLVQLSEFGEIDPAIGFAWEKLGAVDETAAAAIRKSDGDLAIGYIGAGVLKPEDERKRLATSEGSLYPGLDLDDLPDPPEAEAEPGGEDDPGEFSREAA